jgi:AcrR family transcriptional regulator
MPKIVNREERRTEISQIVLRVIGSSGISGATMRNIAREGGFTSGVLSHYFKDKEELINFAFGEIATAAFRRVETRAKKAKTALAKIQIVLEEFLPHEQNLTGSVVSVAFWGVALHDPAFQTQFHTQYEIWRNVLRKALQEALANGEISRPIVVENEIDLLIASADGLNVSILLDPDRITKSRRKALVARIMDPLK